jgi:hypothetical protein
MAKTKLVLYISTPAQKLAVALVYSAVRKQLCPISTTTTNYGQQHHLPLGGPLAGTGWYDPDHPDTHTNFVQSALYQLPSETPNTTPAIFTYTRRCIWAAPE